MPDLTKYNEMFDQLQQEYLNETSITFDDVLKGDMFDQVENLLTALVSTSIHARLAFIKIASECGLDVEPVNTLGQESFKRNGDSAGPQEG